MQSRKPANIPDKNGKPKQSIPMPTFSSLTIKIEPKPKRKKK